MYLYYKEGRYVSDSPLISNFSSLNYKQIQFYPEDLFLEIATDVTKDSQESYLLNFLNNLKTSRAKIIESIKLGISNWDTKKVSFIDEKFIQDGARIVKRILTKNKLI